MLSTEPSRRITAYSTTSPCTRSKRAVGGYFGSTFFSGSGPDKSPVAYRDVLLRSSEKLRIQLPVALFRFGIFTNSVYTFFDAKIISGFAPAGSVAKSGGPLRSASSSLSPFGSGRVINLRGGAIILALPPGGAAGLPPLMLIPTALFPAPLPESAGAFALVGAFGVPDAPGRLPSGETETCAAVLPGGGWTRAGGAGCAESAISAVGPPAAAVHRVAPTSGAGPASPDSVFCATRGAAPAFNSSLGRAGPLCAAGRFMSATCCSRLGTSAGGATFTVAARFSLGCSFCSISSLISKRGLAGPANCWKSTILGKTGSNL